MLYLFYGPDSINIIKKASTLAKSLLSKKPDANFFKLDSNNFDEALIEESIMSRGLFESKYIVFLDRVFGDDKIKSFILDKIKEIGESENIFILAENEIDKKTFLKLEKQSNKTQELNLKEGFDKHKDERKSVFLLTDAFGARDKKKVWIEYQKAIKKDISPEEIHGMLFWQVKSMILAIETDNAGTAGLNPFVYRKAKSFSKNFSIEELRKLSSDIVRIYHEARMGKLELALATEKFLLDV